MKPLLFHKQQISARQIFLNPFNTGFGETGLIWSVFKKQRKVLEILLPRPESTITEALAAAYPEISIQSCIEIDALAKKIRACLAGKNIRFSKDDLDMLGLDLCPPFRRQAMLAAYAIPRGRVSTYGRIAGYLNNPKAARAVGSAMATNPFPIIIPCHRVVKSDGDIGEFGSGRLMKKALLEMEGVEFINKTGVVKDLFWG